jgi:hypothetical protein
MNKNIENNTNFNSPSGAGGRFVHIDGEKYYQISNFDQMQPFFISLASDSNHWMYISSTGGLTAGRKNPDYALFPYYTDDKISESSEITGSKTIFHVKINGETKLWEPFSERQAGTYQLERSIAKSVIGNKLIFTEKNIDLGLTFSYKWMNADDFGWIKKSSLNNDSNENIEVYVVDGLQNVLPSGIDRVTQNTFSTLVDGYKKTELVENCGLALFRMESILVDKAEPSESLRANTIWSYGLENADYLLSSRQLNSIRNGQKPQHETEAKGVRGALFVCTNVELAGKNSKEWYFVAEVSQDIAAVNNLIDFIENTEYIPTIIDENVQKGTEALKNIVAQADGIQQTADENGMARHFANVLFNTMRGGIYSNNYQINSTFFAKHIQHFNKKCADKHSAFLSSLSGEIEYSELEKRVTAQNDPQLYRLFLEYLPLTFSRRHGDPSRPWNLFSINIKDENGDKLLSYQGNWRDIFQNWEALSLSYPAFINSIIAKFLNATTADGYNPYKVTHEGIEWEVIEPENPWSNIGYWGDHQIIYLLKLMEVSQKHYPEKLSSWLNSELFAFANVPYRLKSYAEIVENPKSSIRFDHDLNKVITKLESTYGADAKLMLNANGEVILASFTEKLLATLLAKLSNFIPEAGIWMNTLRPEWNDANNALVGTGASMVTLYYLRRFVHFIKDIYKNSETETFAVSEEMQGFFEGIFGTFIQSESLLNKGFSNETRRTVADELGLSGEKYRNHIYSGFSGQKRNISKTDLLNFLELTQAYIDQSIEKNKRADGMYHAYNLVSFSGNKVEIRYLYEMLEGQVAVLSSGKLNTSETVEVLNALRNSALYRADQQSYILYPNKRLPSFLEKNNIDREKIQASALLTELIEKGDKRIVTTDKKGQFHFNASFNNVGFLREALQKLQKEDVYKVNNSDIQMLENIYEETFDHQSFTGRSGTFYKYEGLGCIYWHMVSKLLLTIGENIGWAMEQHEDKTLIGALKNHYAEVKKGIGAHKSPEEYGSFPFDPYSHTPTMAGVQQPGMTGQVKEDIISRFLELGIEVENGCISINPEMLKKEDFIQSEGEEPYLTFTYCSIPFEYRRNMQKGIEIFYRNGKKEQSSEYLLSRIQSQSVFNRNKGIDKIVIHF